MAHFLAAKRPDEVVQRKWPIPFDSDDNPLTATLTDTGVVVDADEIRGNELVLTLSGGTAAQTGSIEAEIATARGRVLIETLYIPVVESAAQVAPTARDICNFALRKVVGIGNAPTADELNDALEQLGTLVASWREGGADLGSPFPLTANSVIYCPDWSVDALRYNLRLGLYSLYGEEPTPLDVTRANRGLQLVRQRNAPQDRAAVYF